jgi:DNA-directed RNA polymerase
MTISKQIETQLDGARVDLSLQRDTDRLDRRKQSAGISPNWVHSLDASHLMITINTCAENGITDFAMIHDSYATYACDTELLGICLRKAFVAQYSHYDVLADFRARISSQLSPENLEKLLPLPEKGALDPAAVLRSEYFFA